MRTRYSVALLVTSLVFVPNRATATEPRCEFPTCFPMKSEADLVRVFSNDQHRLEVVTVGAISKVTMVLHRLVTPDDSQPRWREAYLVATNDKSGYDFQPLVPGKAAAPKLQFVGEFATAKSVSVSKPGAAGLVVLALDPKATKTLRGAGAIRAYREQTMADNYAVSIAAAQDNLDQELRSVAKSCAANLTGTVDGSKISPAQLVSMDMLDPSGIEHRCLDMVGAIAAWCERNPKQLSKLSSAFTQLQCSLVVEKNNTAALDRKTQTLQINVALHAHRDGRKAFNWLRFLESNLK